MWRSLVARFVRDEEVAGSNPVTPTMWDVEWPSQGGFPEMEGLLENDQVIF